MNHEEEHIFGTKDEALYKKWISAFKEAKIDYETKKKAVINALK